GERMAALGGPPQETLTQPFQVGGPAGSGRHGHAGPAALGPGHEARPLEPVVRLFDGVRGDGQPHGHRPGRGQFLAGPQGPAQDEPADLALDLLPDRGPALEDQFGRLVHDGRSAVNLRTARSTSSGPKPYWATWPRNSAQRARSLACRSSGASATAGSGATNVPLPCSVVKTPWRSSSVYALKPVCGLPWRPPAGARPAGSCPPGRSPPEATP